MGNKEKTIVLASVVLLMVLGVRGGILAQTPPNYNLEWHLVGGGAARQAQPATS
jgi:hypothetical protein